MIALFGILPRHGFPQLIALLRSQPQKPANRIPHLASRLLTMGVILRLHTTNGLICHVVDIQRLASISPHIAPGDLLRPKSLFQGASRHPRSIRQQLSCRFPMLQHHQQQGDSLRMRMRKGYIIEREPAFDGIGQNLIHLTRLERLQLPNHLIALVALHTHGCYGTRHKLVTAALERLIAQQFLGNDRGDPVAVPGKKLQ